MCSTGSNTELQPTTSDPALLLELKTRRPPSLLDLAGCETWSVDFSPDGAWFAWSMGHGIVWVVAWPLDSEEGQDGETDRADKSFSCGHPVWGLAFGPKPPRSTTAAPPTIPSKGSKGKSSLFLATGLENGVIKVWNVLTGNAVFDLRGHEGVVRNLVFPQNGTLTLISSSRDKTLRIWDLAHKGKKVQVLSGHKDWISCCCVSSDCSMIASVGRFDRMVCLWSLRSYTFMRNLTGTNKKLCLLSSCDFSPDGAVLATAAFSGSSWWIDLWDPYTAEKLATLADYFEDYGQNQISAIQFSPDGLHLAIVTEDRQSSEDLGARRETYDNADETRQRLQWTLLQLPSTRGVIATGTRDGHVRFWRTPRTVPSLCHLCRAITRYSVSTQQIEALPLPKRILEYLTYRNIPERLKTCCSSDEEDWES